MKRNDDGYVLPLVLVVLLVLGIVVSSVLTAAMQNLKFQNNAIARTEARCEAEGAVEIVKAQVLSLVGEESKPVMIDVLKDGKATKKLETTEMYETVKAKLMEVVAIFQDPDINSSRLAVNVEIKDEAWSENVKVDPTEYAFPLIITAVSPDGTLSLRCEIQVEGTIKLNAPEDEESEYTCEIETVQVQYTTYQIGGAA